MNKKKVEVICKEFKIHHCDIIARGNYDEDDLIDVISGNRKYIKALYVYNKIDLISLEDVDEIARRDDSIVISVKWNLNIDYLKERI